MGAVDVIIIAFIVIFAFKGTISGFITEAIGILGIILAVLCSYMIYEPLFKVMKSAGFGESGASIAAYICGFVIIYVIVIILGRIIHKTLDVIHLGWINRIFGLFFGFLKGAVIVSLILWIIVYVFPVNIKFVQEINKSRTANAAMQVIPYLYDKLNKISGIDRFNPFKK